MKLSRFYDERKRPGTKSAASGRTFRLPIVPFRLASFHAANGLFFVDPALFAFADKPALVAKRAEHAAPRNLFPEPLEQLILRFVWAYNNNCHYPQPPLYSKPPNTLESQLAAKADFNMPGSFWGKTDENETTNWVKAKQM